MPPASGPEKARMGLTLSAPLTSTGESKMRTAMRFTASCIRTTAPPAKIPITAAITV